MIAANKYRLSIVFLPSLEKDEAKFAIVTKFSAPYLRLPTFLHKIPLKQVSLFNCNFTLNI